MQAGLPVEVAEAVKMVSLALAERINRLATELNDKAVRAAEQRVNDITRATGEQIAQDEHELTDTAQTVDEPETKCDALNEQNDQFAALLIGRDSAEPKSFS